MSSLLAACGPSGWSPDLNEARLRNRAAGPTAGSGCVAFSAADCVRGSERADTVMEGPG
jgi:hypothetical protein